jgi:tetratricopeptide (TPR) repeat protein
VIAIGMIGCAHSEKAAQPKLTTQNTDAKYLAGVQANSLRTFERSNICPKQINAVKGQNWQRILTMANGCVQSNQWAMVELIGQYLAEAEHLGPWGAYYLSLAAEQRQEYPRAIWMIELALKKAPQMALLVYQQGRLYWLARNQTAAMTHLKKAADMDNRIADAHLILGQMALSEGNLSEAKKRFQQTLTVEPRLFAALMGMAEIGIRKKDSALAGEYLAQAVFHHPMSSLARVKQAEVFEQLERNFPEALAAYKRLRSLSKESKLDARLNFDVEAKIKSLENTVKEVAPNQLSQREPSSPPKEEK